MCIPHRPARRLGALLALTLLLAPAAPATWSIVVVDVQTGEVGIASATCVSGINLQRYIAVLVPERGAAAAQSLVDESGNNRLLLWNGIQDGLTPEEMLAALAAQDAQHGTRQYGIATRTDAPLTWHGASVGNARHGVAGAAGNLRYAVQGNLLTGPVVVDAAVAALLDTTGDLGQRLMAAMEAARALGGDGRCSCSGFQPTSCGAPPPSFEKSAHVAFVIVARAGDSLGACNPTQGCASGTYYLRLQRSTAWNGPDPVLELQAAYDVWRQGRIGKADHLLSTVESGGAALVADGVSSLEVLVTLRDIAGQPLLGTQPLLQVAPAPGSPPVALPGIVQPLGQGRYRFVVTASDQAGLGALRLVASDATGAVRLYPDLALRVDPLSELHAGFTAVSAVGGADVPFTLNLGPAGAGRPYLLLASARGSHPGQVLRGLHLPLNPDPFFAFTLGQAGGPSLPGSRGFLDAGGRGTARYLATPQELLPLAGRDLVWAALIGGPAPSVTPTVQLGILP